MMSQQQGSDDSAVRQSRIRVMAREVGWGWGGGGFSEKLYMSQPLAGICPKTEGGGNQSETGGHEPAMGHDVSTMGGDELSSRR